MQQRRRISDNSWEGLVGIGLLSIFAPPVLVFIIQDYTVATIIPLCLFFWIGGTLGILTDLACGQIEFDGEFFYVSSWKGELKITIPISNISLLVRSRYGYRFYYNMPGRKKGFFFFSPNRFFRYDKMVHDLKKANPYFFVSSAYVRGLEFLFFRDEEWFK